MKKRSNVRSKIALREAWMINATNRVHAPGDEISRLDFKTQKWYTGRIPSTVLDILVKNGMYKNPFFGLNLKNIPKEPFEVPWWYRTEFEISNAQIEQTILLAFDGINYRANIWLNGKQVANSETVKGSFRRFKFDISNRIVKGKNILAVEVIPPRPGDFSIGFVDWNPYPPDQNMGIWRDVYLSICGPVCIDHPFVVTDLDLPSFKRAHLKISTELVNHSEKTVSGVLEAVIEDTQIRKQIQLNPKEIKEITFSSQEFEELHIPNPRLWWPNNLGEPDLYDLQLSFTVGEEISDTKNITFGIRKVEDYVNEGGHRGYKINGKKILIKGAGWTDDLFLSDTPDKIEAQIQYAKHMNLNCIRLEGIWGKDHLLYDLCDRHGILLMVGWSCHWEHEEYVGKPVDIRFGGILIPDEIELISKSWQDQIIWLRNHPSIFVWTVGSDKVPKPELERKYIETFNKYDPTRPYLASTGGVGSEQAIITDSIIVSDVSGPSRVKMLGPYDYTPPVYWYTDKDLGGAYGFNTETCPGAAVPPLSSIKKMIPPDHLWPIDEVWEYHCALNVFSNLKRCQDAINNRYGEAKHVEDFTFKSQILNYELMRPMFEAFQVNKKNATGIIQWMFNAAWPKMYWQLFDYFLLPNGAFYGTKKACNAIHIIYNYGDNGIYLINDTFDQLNNFTAHIRLFNLKSQQIFHKKIQLNLTPCSSTFILNLPQIESLSRTYFLDLRLYDSTNVEIGNNFYWLSTKKDVLDYEAEFDDWAFYTPSKEYADFTGLNELQYIEIEIAYKLKLKNEEQRVEVMIENPSDIIAFFIELTISKNQGGDPVTPIFWDDNYITLLPGESRNVSAIFASKDLQGAQAVLQVLSWNVHQQFFNLSYSP